MMPRQVRQSALILTCAVCVSALPFLLVGELPGERWLSENDDHAVPFALTGAVLLAVDVLLPIPSSVVGTMLGARLGFGAGAATAFMGLMAGQSAAYFVSRRFLGQRSLAVPEAPALVALFLSRPVPVLAEAVVLSAGAARVNWPRFLMACGSGNLIYAVVLALSGAELLPGQTFGAGLLLPMLLPAAAWLIWRVVRRVKGKEG